MGHAMVSITEIVKRFKQNSTEELNPLNIATACRDCGMKWIDSMLNPIVTIQIFFLQILHGNTACQHLPCLARMSFTAAGYCKARMRLELEAFQLLLQRSVEVIQQSTLDQGRWFGHRVLLVDGTSFSMPDTHQLPAHFGQSGAQKPGCGFPTAHWLAMLHLGTGMITQMLASPLRTHDVSQTVELHPELKRDDLLVGDRAFCSFAHWALLIGQCVHAVLRIHQGTIVDFNPRRPHIVPGKDAARKGLPRSRWLRGLGVRDQIVLWFKPVRKPDGMTGQQFASLPDELTVREL